MFEIDEGFWFEKFDKGMIVIFSIFCNGFLLFLVNKCFKRGFENLVILIN